MTKQTNFIATVTDINSEFPPKGAAVPNSNRCTIKDQTGETAGSVGVANNWYVNETSSPFVTYTNPRLPRWQDLVQTTTTTTTASCPTCSYATSIGTTTSCSAGTATQNVSINSSCGNSEARLSANGNGAITTGYILNSSFSSLINL